MTPRPFTPDPVSSFTPDAGVGNPGASRCDDMAVRTYEVVPAAIAATCCLFGLIYCFFGYRCFKAVMFLTGLLFGSLVIFLLCHKEQVFEARLGLEASAGVAVAIGLLCGLVTMLLRSVGLFVTGLTLGLLLASAALVVAEQFAHPPSAWVPAGALLGAGVVCALLALHWQKAVTVAATSALGAAAVTAAADYFAEGGAALAYAYERLHAARSEAPPCWYSWAVMAAWPVLALLGGVVQWRLTADGYSHSEVIIRHHRKRVPLKRIRQQDARKRVRGVAQPEATYRRKPCSVKRIDGDVLSPSYIRSVRDRQHGTSLSSLAAPPHAVVDVEFDSGSMVPLTAANRAVRK
ncbi:transmembrane protein 198-like [Lethenteron reissneri]|uniref:transmembrane protein 198-like n=1 Tax=Lethenteron reissneri TaxID=7753 RepID=UPI002AB7F196|nr:transmembrane protein 198-like [Lethenteron reissneri]